jgi:hypothetical protein
MSGATRSRTVESYLRSKAAGNPTVEYILALIDSPFAEKPWIEAKIIREVKHELNSSKTPPKQ